MLRNNSESKEVCKICSQEFKKINSAHLRTHNITLQEYHRLYDPSEYRVDVLSDFLDRYYIFNRTKFLSYYYDKSSGSLVPRTIDIQENIYRNYCLSMSDLRAQVRARRLYGVFFHKSLRKILAFDVDTPNIKILHQLVQELNNLNITSENYLISKSGPTNYHLDLLFDVLIYQNQAQKIYDYIHARLNLAPGEKVECRSGKGAQGYKMPFGYTYKNHIDVRLASCDDEGNEIPIEQEADFVLSKRGLIESDLQQIFAAANSVYEPVRKLSKVKRNAIEIRKAMARAAWKLEQKRIQKERDEKQKQREIERAQKLFDDFQSKQKSCLYYTYRDLAVARCYDIETLIIMRGGNMDGMRNNTLFCYAVCYKGTFTTAEKLHRELIRINRLFTNPEDENKIPDIVKHALAPDIMQFKTETIISWLHITEAEEFDMNVLRCERIKIERKNKRRREIRKLVSEKAKQEKFLRVSELLKAGYNCYEIGQAMNLSKRTIERYRRQLKDKAVPTVVLKKQTREPDFVASHEEFIYIDPKTNNYCFLPPVFPGRIELQDIIIF